MGPSYMLSLVGMEHCPRKMGSSSVQLSGVLEELKENSELSKTHFLFLIQIRSSEGCS